MASRQEPNASSLGHELQGRLENDLSRLRGFYHLFESMLKGITSGHMLVFSRGLTQMEGLGTPFPVALATRTIERVERGVFRNDLDFMGGGGIPLKPGVCFMTIS